MRVQPQTSVAEDACDGSTLSQSADTDSYDVSVTKAAAWMRKFETKMKLHIPLHVYKYKHSCLEVNDVTEFTSIFEWMCEWCFSRKKAHFLI